MKVFGWFVVGFFAVAGIATVFVQAGNGKSGQSGGEQTATIIGAIGGLGSSVAQSLETGSAPSK